MKRLIKIGRIKASSGLKGRVAVSSFLEAVKTAKSLEEVFVGNTAQSASRYSVASIYTKGKKFYLEFKGINDRAVSDSLIGQHVFMPYDKLRVLPADEFYWEDLIGLEVISTSGKKLGWIETILSTGSNDVYICKGGEREILLPAISDVIKEINLKKNVMVVELFEGL